MKEEEERVHQKVVELLLLLLRVEERRRAVPVRCWIRFVRDCFHLFPLSVT